MSGWLPRRTPAGDILIAGNDTIEINGIPIPNGYGTGGQWLTASEIQRESNVALYTYNGAIPGADPDLDGELMRVRWPEWIPQRVGVRSGNDLSAGGGRWAVFETSPIPRIRFDDSAVWPGFSRPTWNDDGKLFACTTRNTAILLAGPPSAMEIVNLPDGRTADDAREISYRYGALCWSRQGRIYGRKPGGPVEDLTLGDWEAKPIPILASDGVWWLLSHDQTRVILRPWGSRFGHVVHPSPTDGPHDARYSPSSSRIIVDYSVRGVPFTKTYALDEGREDLLVPEDEPLEEDPNGTIADTRPYVLGQSPSLSPPGHPDGPTFYIPKGDDPHYAEWWPLAAGGFLHAFDATRWTAGSDGHPNPDPGWWLGDISERGTPWIPFRIKTGDVVEWAGPIHDLETGHTGEFRYDLTFRVLRHGTVFGRRAHWEFTFDNRPLMPPGERRPGNYEVFTFGEIGPGVRGLLRWQSWKRNRENTADHLDNYEPKQRPPDPGPPGQPRAYVNCPRPTTRPPVDPPVKEDPLIRYEELVNLEGRLQDTYQNHGHHPERLVPTNVDAEGEVWRRAYFDLRRGGLAHEAATRRIESQIDLIEGRPDRWAGGAGGEEPIGDNRQVVHGPIRVDNLIFRNDSGPYFPAWASCLYGLSSSRDPRSLLDQLAALGFGGVRVFAGHLEGRDQTAVSARERLPFFLSSCLERGLHVQVCAITDSGRSPYDIYHHVDQVARICAAYGHIVLELVNEIGHPTQRDDINLPRLADVARAAGFAGPLTAGGTVEGDELDRDGRYGPGGIGNVIDAHLRRDTSPGGVPMPFYHEASRMTEIGKIRDAYHRAGMSGEPNRVEQKDNPESFGFLLGAIGRGLNLGTVFHSSQARDVQVLTGVQLEAARTFLLGHRLVSMMDPGPYGFINGHWAEAPINGVRWYDPDRGKRVWRAFTFTSGIRGLLLLTGLQGMWRESFESWQNGWSFQSVITIQPGAALLDIRR